MRGDWLKIWMASHSRSTPRWTALARPPAGETWAPISTAGDTRGRARSLRPLAHRRAARRQRPYRALQLAPRPRKRGRDGAAHRGHRPRALDAGERRDHLRRDALA